MGSNYMSERKYRQRGYQDEPREREPKREKKPVERAPGRQLQDAAAVQPLAEEPREVAHLAGAVGR